MSGGGAVVDQEPTGGRVGRGEGTEAERARYIRRMFGAIAPRYDLANTLISAGLHRTWKRIAAAMVAVPPGGRALDACCGTGDLALLLGRHVGPRGRVVGVDISEEMLTVARRKARAARLETRVHFTLGDAEALGFPAAAFDGATVGFGIRNTVRPAAALRELCRVLRPGGRLSVLEFSVPENPVLRRLYDWYLFTVMPRLGRLASCHDDAYLYLTASVRTWADQKALSGMMVQAGFAQVRYYNFLAGVVAIHLGVRPATVR